MTFDQLSEYTETSGTQVDRDASGVRAVVRAVVTGCAGFIGSHLVDELLALGWDVVGIDNLDPWYAPSQKIDNLCHARSSHRFIERLVDLGHIDLVEAFADADVVFHLAGRPGVQDSWGEGFSQTCELNVAMTQRVLEAAEIAGVRRVVLASSSSVYGNAAPDGRRMVAPISPYGVSKAAAEQLAAVYGLRGVEVVVLRYFTVYGPRQRPDMAIHRLFTSCLDGVPFRRRGSGAQSREFTFVGDVVAATIAASVAAPSAVAGAVLDVGGGAAATLNEVIAAVEQLTERPAVIVDEDDAAGDPRSTTADLDATSLALDWRPRTSLWRGLTEQEAWHRTRTHHLASGRDSGRDSARDRELRCQAMTAEATTPSVQAMVSARPVPVRR